MMELNIDGKYVTVNSEILLNKSEILRNED